jgi:hypothetical protein
LQATFAIDLKTSDVPHTDEAGFWYLTLTPAHGYAFGRVPSDPEQNTGVLTVSGATLTLSGERGQGACPGAGTYRWAATGDTLSLTLVDDPCLVRDDQSTAHPYRRCAGGPSTCVKPG